MDLFEIGGAVHRKAREISSEPAVNESANDDPAWSLRLSSISKA
jgi:hypothetical protein